MSRRVALVAVVLVLCGVGPAAAEEPPSPNDDPAAPAAAQDASAPAEAPAEPAAAEPWSGAPDAVPPAAPPAAAAGASKAPRTGGLIRHVLFGPKVTATILFPPNVMVGGELKIAGYLGASFERAVYPKERAAKSGYDGRISAWSAGLRAFPGRGSFFLGVVAGEYEVVVTQAVEGATPGGGASLDTLTVKCTYVGPQLGWKWVSDAGLFAGLNLGYGFSVRYASTFVPASPGSPGGQTDLEDAKKTADQHLKSGAPILTLLELGWVF